MCFAGFGSGPTTTCRNPSSCRSSCRACAACCDGMQWFRLELAAQTSSVASQFSFRDKNVDFEQLEVRIGEKRMPLTLMEAALLRYLVQHAGPSRATQGDSGKVWGVRDDTDTRAIDNFIVRLRRYIEDEPASPRHLQTIRGVGYRFVADPD